VNKEEFLNVDREDWWLVDPDVDLELQQLRDQLGAALGYQSERDWYTKKEGLETLWTMVETREDLQSQLEMATAPDLQRTWVETVTKDKEEQNKKAKGPDPKEVAAKEAADKAAAEKAAADKAAAAATPVARKASPFRKDDGSSVAAEAEAPSAPSRPRSPFPTKSEAAESQAPSAPSGPRSPFPAKAPPVEPGVVTPAASAPDSPPEVEHIDVEELKSSVSVLESAGIELSAEDIDKLAATPGFDERVAEAEAELRAAAAAADDDEDWEDEEEEELQPAGET
jgi:hypothetical protein